MVGGAGEQGWSAQTRASIQGALVSAPRQRAPKGLGTGQGFWKNSVQRGSMRMGGAWGAGPGDLDSVLLEGFPTKDRQFVLLDESERRREY